MISEASVVAPPQALRELQRRRPQEGVLSAYLDTSPQRARGRAFVISFVDGCKAARLAVGGAERQHFEASVEQAGRYLSAELSPKSLGLAVFASGRLDYFYAVPLPYRPVDSVSWGARPHLALLQAVLDEYERVAVLLFDSERARLFSVFLGAVEEEREIADDVPGKQATGGWFGLAQSRYARHREDHVRRHADHATAALMEMEKQRPFDRLFVAGPDEAIASLREVLPGPLRAKIVGRLRLEMFAGQAEVLATTLPEAARVERQVEAAEVAELIEEIPSPWVVTGLDETLSALNDGRVHTLFVADQFRSAGSQCQACGRLLPETSRCPFCGGSTLPIADLHEQVVERAVERGAWVESVSGPAAAELEQLGGVGGWTRY
jgi:peptide chain release factor subunit 1